MVPFPDQRRLITKNEVTTVERSSFFRTTDWSYCIRKKQANAGVDTFTMKFQCRPGNYVVEHAACFKQMFGAFPSKLLANPFLFASLLH